MRPMPATSMVRGFEFEGQSDLVRLGLTPPTYTRLEAATEWQATKRLYEHAKAVRHMP